jgi:hypothetical protein
MPVGRPAVPRELRRQLLVEAGHRCAIHTCRNWPLEIAHIVPWAEVRSHDFDNMIALCPTCHTRFDRGEISRLEMLEYKKALQTAIRDARLLDAYRSFQTSMTRWESTIGAIESLDVSWEPDDQLREKLVDRCALEGGRAHRALDVLAGVAEEATTGEAEELFSLTRFWADDVTDGLWPSTHPGANRHDHGGFDSAAGALHEAVAHELGLDPSALPKRPRTAESDDGPPLSIGGSGMRF